MLSIKYQLQKTLIIWEEQNPLQSQTNTSYFDFYLEGNQNNAIVH